MMQYGPDSGYKSLNETRAGPPNSFRSVKSHDGLPRKPGLWRSRPPNRAAFLIVLAINTLVAVTAWFVVAAIRG